MQIRGRGSLHHFSAQASRGFLSPHASQPSQPEGNSCSSCSRKWQTSLPLTSHWPKAVTWPHLSSKGVKKSHPTMCLRGGENWDISEWHYFQPQWPSPYFHMTYPKPFSWILSSAGTRQRWKSLWEGSAPIKAEKWWLVYSRRQPNRDASEEAEALELMLSNVILQVFPKQVLWFQDVQGCRPRHCVNSGQR